MKQIKFSEWYKKFLKELIGIRQAKLIQLFKCNYKDLSEDFIYYDTTYDGGRYVLPKTELIVLIFVYNFQIFTTIRRFTPKKYEYYRNAVGEEFEIVVENQSKDKKEQRRAKG